MLSLSDSTLRFRHSVCVLVPLVAIGIASHTHAADIYVDASIPQSGTGVGGFENAKKTLQEALTLAAQTLDLNDVVHIAKGIYYVSDGVTGVPLDPRDLSFVLPTPPNTIQLIGGYPPGGGPETSRNVLTNEVILCGDRLKNDPTTESGLAAIFDQQNFGTGSPYADNVYHTFDCSGVSSATVLDSVTIRGGHANGPVARGNGAGIYAPNGTPTLRSCVVEFNRCKVTTAPSGSVTEPIDGAGGGLYATDGGALTIQGTTLRYNQAMWGAGLFRGPLDDDPITTAHVDLVGCRLERNRCFTSGVSGARPRGGGALFEINTGIIRIESCEFLHNTSDLSSDGEAGGSALVIAPAFHCEGDCLTACVECSDTCVYGSGTPPCTSMACPQCLTHVFITNSLFAGNSSRGAGAAIKMSRKALFQDCTIAWNVREGPCLTHASAGVLVGHKSHSELSNCILFDNQDLSACGWSPLQEQISADTSMGSSASYAFQYSDVEGLCISPCSPASGNISAPPQFAATPDDGADNQWGTSDDVFGDYTLGSGSYCADAGSDALLPQDGPFDLDRDGVLIEPLPVDVGYLTRRKEAGVGAVDQRVDMGAHELGCREDFNGDGSINGTDLAFTLSAWTGEDAHYLPCPSFVQEDLDRNCRVDGFDLSLLLGAWGTCGVSGLSGGGGGEAASSGPAEESGCEGSYELFLQWVESGDWDAFLQWHQCFMQLSGGS